MTKREKRRQQQANARALRISKRRLGTGSDCNKRDVFLLAARALGRPMPRGSVAGYALLHAFIATPERWQDVPQVPETGPHSHRPAPNPRLVVTDAFLESYEWRRLRMEALKLYGRRCQCCGATPADGVRMQVDHIKPRKFYPELSLTLANLQVLCDACNHGKGNWDETDWRPAAPGPRLVGKAPRAAERSDAGFSFTHHWGRSTAGK